MTIEEARRRFAQFATLYGIASVASLRESLVLKGGNALDFVWQPNRSTIDLDFSLDMAEARFEIRADVFRDQLRQGFTVARTRFGVLFAINSVRQQPPGEDKTFVTYTARVGYGLPDQGPLLLRMEKNQPSPYVLPIEISINEPIGASTRFGIDSSVLPIRVCTLEDIVAEKLRSLLQQPIRNRNRKQDVLDIAVILQANPDLEKANIATYLEIKARARDVPVSKVAFRNPEIAARARLEYDQLAETTRKTFVPFEKAFSMILAFVETLAIAEE